MSHDKNLINQIKYNKSVKNNPNTRALQEIPYTALDPLITVNDNVLFSIVDQDNAVNNKMTVLQLRQYIKSTMNLYKNWTVADGNTLTLTEDELNSNQKIIITTEDLSSLSGDFQLTIPDTWDDSLGIKIEIDYKNSNFPFTESRLLDIKKSNGNTIFESFLFKPIGFDYFSVPYSFRFEIINSEFRNPFGSFARGNSSTLTGGKVIFQANNRIYKIVFNGENGYTPLNSDEINLGTEVLYNFNDGVSFIVSYAASEDNIRDKVTTLLGRNDDDTSFLWGVQSSDIGSDPNNLRLYSYSVIPSATNNITQNVFSADISNARFFLTFEGEV